MIANSAIFPTPLPSLCLHRTSSAPITTYDAKQHSKTPTAGVFIVSTNGHSEKLYVLDSQNTIRDTAGWLSERWKGRLSNLHRIFLLHFFLSPLERYSPQSKISPLLTNEHPTIFKGPSPTNLAYLADLEKVEIQGIYNAMKATYKCHKTTKLVDALGNVIEEGTESMTL
jgi:hypothetical protein